MKFIETHDPDILKTRSGGGFLMLFGLPFLLAGLFIMATPLELFPINDGDAPWYFVVPFGLVFATVGAGLMFGRSGVIIDRRQNVITKWYGLLVPMKQTQWPLDLYKQLTITKEIRRGDKTSYTVYPLSLTGGPGAEQIKFEEPREYQTARKSGELLARFLKVPVADSSSGEKVIRDAERLDESIREKARRTGERVKIPEAPLDTKVKVHQESGEVLVEIPATGITPIAYLKLAMQMVFMVVIVVWFLLPMVRDMGISKTPIFLYLAGLAFILMLVFTLGSALVQARRYSLITASRHILRIVNKTPFRKKVIEIPADELEELEAIGKKGILPEGFSKTPDGRLMIDQNQYGKRLQSDTGHYDTGGNSYIPGPKMTALITGLAALSPHSKGIVARSDTKSIQFGSGLSEVEMDYVHAVIKKAMTE